MVLIFAKSFFLAKRPTIEALIGQVARLTKRVDRLEKENAHIRKENLHLKKENVMLGEKLARYENPKNSRNSSLPPSKDENRPSRTRSLREQTGKKPGGQRGHEGNTLKMSPTPERITEHIPGYCSLCGKDISDLPCELMGRRQVVDIPPVQPEYTEHRVYQRTCSCGHITKSAFPPGVSTPVSYGNGVESLIGYLHTRQYIPFDRMKEFFHDVFSLPISEGGLHHILNRLSAKALPVYEMIRERIAESHVVGSDETGVKVNGKKHWFWTWQNTKLTFIAVSENRGFKTIEDNFKEGLPLATMVHDCWKPHFQTRVQNHQLCLAHLLRELEYLAERYKHPWPGRLKAVFSRAIALKKQMKPGDYYCHCPPRSKIEEALDALLEASVDEKQKELTSFKKRMVRYREYLLSFLYHPQVPPDNNGAERAIRNVKVKQKISGQFKAIAGAKQFALLRSITDTAIKNGQNVLNALALIANGYATE